MTAIEFSRDGEPATAWQPGDAIVIRAGALVPGSDYVLRVARRVRGEAYASTAALAARADGTVDTRDNPDRPFWSMRRVSDAVDDGLIACSLARGGEVIACGRLAIASPRGDDVTDGIVGRIFYPTTTRDPAAVVVLGGSNGGIDDAEGYAAALARRGFVALALAYFGMPGLPETLDGIALEYVERALAWLRGHSRVGAERIGLVGRSRGGELALLVAARLRGVAAVVAHAASTYAWSGMAGGPAWTHDGAPLPHLVVSPAHVDIAVEDGHSVVAPCAAFREALARATPAALAAARIPVDAPTLLLCGGDDAVWPSAWFAADAASRSGAVDVRVWGAAGHRATMLPGDPTTDGALPHRAGGWLRHGGTPEGDGRAQREGLELAVAFLRRELTR